MLSFTKVHCDGYNAGDYDNFVEVKRFTSILDYMESVKELRVRYWIYLNGNKFFGVGRAQLLKHIEESGSIANAAKAMGMSYKKAWAMVDDMNSKAKEPYVVAKKGGKSGGGTELTDAGRKMLEAYNSLNTKLALITEAEKEILSLI